MPTPTPDDLLPATAGTAEGLLAEVCDALEADLAILSPDSWQLPVIYDWTVRDVVIHLAAVNDVLLSRLAGHEHSVVERVELDDATAALRCKMHGATPEAVVERWVESVRALQQHADREGLVGWVEFPIPTSAAIVDRAFETWIHANDIRNAIGRASLDPSAQSFGVLCELAAQLLPLTLLVARRPHSGLLQLSLSGAGGGEWSLPLGEGGEQGLTVSIAAAARDLCLLMGDRVDPRDFACTVRGDEGADEIARDLVHSAPVFARP